MRATRSGTYIYFLSFMTACVVELENQWGDQLSFEESTPGYYRTMIPEDFMRRELLETYEFHNPDYEGFIYSYDRALRPLPDSLDDRQCWISGHINALYTLDAANLKSPTYTYMPLHFVSNETQRFCWPAQERPRFRYLMTADLPVYVSNAEDAETGEVHSGETILECLGCKVRSGSSGDAPDFWPIE